MQTRPNDIFIARENDLIRAELFNCFASCGRPARVPRLPVPGRTSIASMIASHRARCEKQKNFPRPCFLVLARRRDGHREPIVGDFAALLVPNAVQYESPKDSGRARSP